jgi:monofunctional biosynthetic peptidoglycan transglycosylase
MAKRPKSNIPQYKRRRSKRSLPVRILLFVVKLVVAFVVISALWVLAYRFINPPITATMLGDIFAGRGATRDWMEIEEIDRDMVRAAIAAEDSKFCEHSGFDLQAIEEAAKRNASGGRIRGGSTISQQTAKNAFLWQGGGYFRKGLEAWFTLLMEAMWDKRRIMEVYLNIAETGIGTYGVNAGAQRYFSHDSSALSRTEAARIAAVLPLPKKREAIAPSGFTRRYGNSISKRIGVVARDGLDSCLRSDAVSDRNELPEEPQAQPKRTESRKSAPEPSPTPQPERVEDYIEPGSPEMVPGVEIVDPPPPPAENPDLAPPVEPEDPVTNGL